MNKSNKSKPLVIVQCYEDRQQTLPLRKTEHMPHQFAASNHQPKREATDNPPPPPPMPVTNGHQNGEHKNGNNDISTLKNTNKNLNNNSNIKKNGSLLRTPTPDYNNSLHKKDSSVPIKLKNIKDEKAEMDSLESFKLKNPSNIQPRPPSNYFVKAPNGTATMKKHLRPVSVTIGEYASGGGGRREPSKLEFLNGDQPDGPNAPDDVPISNRLQSELVMTLSRSNLRKKTETLADASR